MASLRARRPDAPGARGRLRCRRAVLRGIGRLGVVVALAGAVATLAGPAFGAGGEAVDYDTLMAVYVERFTRFVEWPASTGIADAGKPFVIGVLGDGRLVRQFEESYRTQLIRGKPVKVIALSDPQSLPACQLIFIAGSERDRLGAILEVLRRRPVLTVADSAGFAEAGVHINLFRADGRLRFEVNEPAVKEAGLQIGYQLLSYARSVVPGKGSR